MIKEGHDITGTLCFVLFMIGKKLRSVYNKAV